MKKFERQKSIKQDNGENELKLSIDHLMEIKPFLYNTKESIYIQNKTCGSIFGLPFKIMSKITKIKILFSGGKTTVDVIKQISIWEYILFAMI